MILHVPIGELVSLIKNRTDIDVILKIVDSSTVNIGYDMKVKVPFLGLISKNVNLDLTIVEIQDEMIYARCAVGAVGINKLFRIVESVYPSFEDIVEIAYGDLIIIKLREIEVARKVLDNVTLNGITFCDGIAEIDFNVKEK